MHTFENGISGLWVNYDNSLTWNKAIKGDDSPKFTNDSSEVAVRSLTHQYPDSNPIAAKSNPPEATFLEGKLHIFDTKECGCFRRYSRYTISGWSMSHLNIILLSYFSMDCPTYFFSSDVQTISKPEHLLAENQQRMHDAHHYICIDISIYMILQSLLYWVDIAFLNITWSNHRMNICTGICTNLLGKKNIYIYIQVSVQLYWCFSRKHHYQSVFNK